MEEKSNQPGRREVLSRLGEEIPGILIGRPVMFPYLFGSVADGIALPSSDVDIALVLEPGCKLAPYDRMKMEFDIAAEVEKKCKVNEADVRSIDCAPLAVKGTILTEGILLYSRDEEFRVEYETYTRKMYWDFQPVAGMMREAFFRQLKEEGLTGGKAR